MFPIRSAAATDDIHEGWSDKDHHLRRSSLPFSFFKLIFVQRNHARRNEVEFSHVRVAEISGQPVTTVLT